MRSIFSNRWRQSLSAFFPLGIAGLLVMGLGQLGLLMPLVQAEYGLRFRLRGQQAWAKEVVLIAIDDSSLAALEAFPWRRQHYADLLEQLQGYPSVVVFDLLFSDPSPDDGEFARAIAAHPAVILATAWDRQGRSLEPAPPLAQAALALGHIVQHHQGGYIHSVEPMVGGQPALAIVTAEALGLTQPAVPLPPSIAPCG